MGGGDVVATAQMMGARYVEVFPTTIVEMHQRLMSAQGAPQYSMPPTPMPYPAAAGAYAPY